jgi:hypothetical protein
MAEFEVVLSVTETKQYRRIIEFIREVDQYASATGDERLAGIVGETLDDLLGMALDG